MNMNTQEIPELEVKVQYYNAAIRISERDDFITFEQACFIVGLTREEVEYFKSKRN